MMTAVLRDGMSFQSKFGLRANITGLGLLPGGREWRQAGSRRLLELGLQIRRWTSERRLFAIFSDQVGRQLRANSLLDP